VRLLVASVSDSRLGGPGGTALPANGTPSAVPEEPPYQHASAVAGRTGLPLTGR